MPLDVSYRYKKTCCARICKMQARGEVSTRIPPEPLPINGGFPDVCHYKVRDPYSRDGVPMEPTV